MKLDGSGTADATIVTVPGVLLYCSDGSVLDAKKVFKPSIKLIVNVSPGAGGNAVLEVTLRVANKSGDELTMDVTAVEREVAADEGVVGCDRCADKSHGQTASSGRRYCRETRNWDW